MGKAASAVIFKAQGLLIVLLIVFLKGFIISRKNETHSQKSILYSR